MQVLVNNATVIANGDILLAEVQIIGPLGSVNNGDKFEAINNPAFTFQVMQSMVMVNYKDMEVHEKMWAEQKFIWGLSVPDYDTKVWEGLVFERV